GSLAFRTRRIVWRWGRSCGLGTVAFEHADQIRLSSRRPPGSLVLTGSRGKRGGDGREERQGRGAWARRRRRGGGRGAHAGRGVRGGDRRGEGVRDGVHAGAGEPPGPPAAEGVAGGSHLRAGDRADGPPARRGHPAARTGIHVRLLAHLAAPRGALLYSRLSREEFGGYSWVRWLTQDPKGEGDNSMPGNQRPRQCVWAAHWGTRAIWLKLDCLNPNLQKG